MTAGSIKERAVLLNAMAQRAGREVCGKDILSLSLGAAFYPKDGVDAQQLLAEADRRMYAAKRIHYESVRFGSPKSGAATSFIFYEEKAHLNSMN
jgi:GGDEF domain-containing protein